MNTIRDEMADLMGVLRKSGDDHSANEIEDALAGSEEDFWAFLVSNEVWGGSGFIADQGGVNGSGGLRKEITAIMVRIGRMQMSENMVNPRTEMWVDAFEQWQMK